MGEKKYNQDGWLIVCETDKCPLWEKTTSRCNLGWAEDCYYCKYSDFRTEEYIRCIEEALRTGKLYSICHNEKNRTTAG